MRILAWPSDDPENPYNRQLYAHMREIGAEVRPFTPLRLVFGSDDALHVHWPEHVLNKPNAWGAALKLLAMFALMDLSRLSGKKIVWTVHNLRAHEGLHPRLEKWFWRALTARLSGYISLSTSGKEAALGRFPVLRGLPGFIIPHGHYRGSYPASVSKVEARKQLEVEQVAPILVFLGNIRPYKNLAHLIRVFRGIDNPATRLLVAGCGEEDVLEEIKRLAEEDTRIRLFLDYVPEERVQLFMRGADLVVLPFREILNSGSALLALSFDCPILVPRRGAMADLQALVGDEWVRTYTDTLTSTKLREALDWALTVKRGETAPLDALDWGRIARSTLEAFRTIVGVTSRSST